MIVVKKKIKKPLLIAILAAVLAVVTVAAILLDTLLLVDIPEESEKAEPPTVDTSIGESIYLNSAIAYPRADEEHISSIYIKGERWYGFSRQDIDGDPETADPLVFSYQGDDGEWYKYLPNIMNADGNFEYNDVYALEQNDGYGTIMKLTYLTTAIGTLYFDEKMPLSDNNTEKKKELSAFGFGEEDDPILVNLTYNVHGKKDDHSDEKEAIYTVKIGNKLATNSGYYYMVGENDGEGNVKYRDYIYTTYTTYLDYAFVEFTDFVNPILVAKGLAKDNAFEPYLTTDYQQYKNTLYEYNEKENYYPEVVSGSNVIVSADIITPDTSIIKKNKKEIIKGGLLTLEDEDVDFALGKYTDLEDQNRLINLLVGKKTGKYSTPFSITIPVYSTSVETDAKKSVEYVYVIKSIDAILTDSADETAAGTLVAAGDKIKVTYSLTKGGKAASENDLSGVLDLSSSLIPDDVKNSLIGSAVGSLAGKEVEFKRTYTKDNSVNGTVEMVVTRIIRITDPDDVTESYDSVIKGAKVDISYYYIVNGVRVEGSDDEMSVIIGDEKNSSKAIDDALMGKSVDKDLAIRFVEYKTYSEVFATYTEYAIDEIKYFVVKEKIVSFKFQQASDRDPYYGESFYVNTTGGDYAVYALNASACEGVVKILGGLITNANSSTGLVGTKTVDVVITPAKMKKYGLYAYSIYFELPRGIEAKVYSGTSSMEDYLTSLDDYTYDTTLGFNLYISEEDPATGTRYIASDLYDVIAEIPSKNLVFLNHGFIDFYARRNLVLTNLTNIDSVKLEFMMDDIYGTYENKLNHNWLYAYAGGLYEKSELSDSQLEMATKYDAIDVVITPTGECVETAFSKLLEEKNYSFASLRELYGNEWPNGEFEMDLPGTFYFKEFIQALYFTSYTDFLSEDEQKAGFENGKKVMSMTVRMNTASGGASAFDYVYDFYRISDRRVMVNLYKKNHTTGEVIAEASDFYVSLFSFKKLVNKYFGVLNGEAVDNEVPSLENSMSK